MAQRYRLYQTLDRISLLLVLVFRGICLNAFDVCKRAEAMLEF